MTGGSDRGGGCIPDAWKGERVKIRRREGAWEQNSHASDKGEDKPIADGVRMKGRQNTLLNCKGIEGPGGGN